MCDNINIVIGNVRLDRTGRFYHHRYPTYKAQIFFLPERKELYELFIGIGKDGILFESQTLCTILDKIKNELFECSVSFKYMINHLRTYDKQLSIKEVVDCLSGQWRDAKSDLFIIDFLNKFKEFLESIQRRVLECVSHPLGADWSNYFV